jgi:lantibiotic biosynthesis protein
MNDYQYSSRVIARMPLLDCLAANNEYATILERKDFRTALFFASRSFYNELSKKQFNYSLLSGKEKQTIKKYINRAGFRATPFGLFASISLMDWGSGDDNFELDGHELDIKLDFAVLHELWERQLEKRTSKEERFQSNASLYFNSIDFRYIKKLVESNHMKFSVVSIEKDRTLKFLLHLCRSPKTFEQILQSLSKRNVCPNEAANFVQDLVREQILVSDFSPNITGPDYFHLHANLAAKGSVIGAMESQLQKKIPAAGALKELVSFAGKLDDHLSKTDGTNYFYCVSELKIKKGSIDQRHQKTLEEGLHCLRQLAQPKASKDLQSFVESFVRKYETQEMPLLEVLDAQFGIGYGGLDQIKASYGFASTGYEGSERKKAVSVSGQNELSAWLIKEWHSWDKYSPEIEITDHQLQHLDNAGQLVNPAPSISILFRTLGEKVFIESAGGVSALALLGRFCFFENVYQYAKAIAGEEQRQNKNVIFAEIAHLCHLHTANINRRPHLYDYEIPVLTSSKMPEEKQIPLSDLMISVRNNKLVLRSKKLKKRIIPRLSSAFNYTRNDLPIFRFLCDLQFQDIQPNLSFSLSSAIPGLPFYPRVSYKSCILQLAEWHLDATEISTVKNSADIFTAFQQFAHSINLPGCFSYGVGDNFLVFDSGKKEDITLFLSEVENKKTIVLKEFPFLSEAGILTTNEGNFLPQYMASLVLQKEVYDDPLSFSDQSESETDTSDWVYFKLYCHPLSSDTILLHYLFVLIKKLKKESLLINWFWVRYNDPDYHLRIRVRAKPGSKRKVVQLITIGLDKICSQKLGTHFQTDRYKRELERYSPKLIQQVEQVFQASSELVAGWLTGQKEFNYEDPNVILDAVQSSLVILSAFGISDKAGFCKKSFEGFFTEFNASKELKTEMEKLYRQVSRETDAMVCSSPGLPQYECLVKSVKSLVATHEEKRVSEVSIEKLATDIIHMHLNRHFIYNQRYFEMIHYFLLYRALFKHLYKLAQ